MIRRILCRIFGHRFREREYAEQFWEPFYALWVCRRCGKAEWR